ncbi:MAG: hypothetical protein K5839_06670 [Treponemataceae bacterium]|nr:hypothetical protein [Treponemataceae bacterium]
MKMKHFTSVLLFFLLPLSMFAANKRVMYVDKVSTSANTLINNANDKIACGYIDDAYYFLDKAYKLAVSVDNYNLLTKIEITRINAMLSSSSIDYQKADELLENAYYFASCSNDNQKNSALCLLCEIRLNLSKNTGDYEAMLSKLNTNQTYFKKNLFEQAQFESVKADLYAAQKNYSAAESSYLNAVNTFTKESYLSEIGITWYKIARVRFLNGKVDSSLEALNSAIKYDRDAENSFALGSDYYLKGIILSSEKENAASIEKAKKAFYHSAEIFNAVDNESAAKRSMEEFEKLDK